MSGYAATAEYGIRLKSQGSFSVELNSLLQLMESLLARRAGWEGVDHMTEKHRILLVDDEADNRDMLSRRLQRNGFEIALAESGEEAVDRIAREPFDLVLLDSVMPGMNGIVVLKLVRAVHSAEELPIIMVTAITQGDHIAEALD